MKKLVFKITALTVIFCMVFAMSAYAVPGKSNGNAYGLRKNKHAQFMIQEQIMKGDGNGNYFLDDYVNRGAAMVMIVHAFKLAAAYEGNFPDVEEGTYFYEAVGIAKSLGITKGDGQKFNPNAYVTIGQAVLLIERSLEASGLESDASLRDIYDVDSTSYATRQDIADMLYYVLTGDLIEDTGDALDTIYYSTDSNTAADFDADDFADEFADIDSDGLSYLYFTIPDSDKGVLFYEDTAITASRKISLSRLDDISFQPASNYSGSVYISYTAYDEDGDSYSGLVKITVTELETLDTIHYSTDSNAAADFDADDFADEFSDVDSDGLAYLYFTIPDSDQGVLYYEETAITASRKISLARLDDISFEPASDFSGSVYLSYTAYDEEGDSYSGLVKITVTEPETLGTIHYSTDSNTAADFDADDFADEFSDVDSDGLSYLYFTIPDAEKGVLFYEDTAITASRKISVSRLDDISFEPASDFSGSVYLSYTAYDGEGDSYSGLVKITVAEPETLHTLTYTTNMNAEVYFVDSHFIRAFNAVDDDENSGLDYVTFYDLPGDDEGTLYYGTSEVTESTKYYAGRLDNISFEPTSDFAGSVTVYYVAHGEDGNCYNGTVKITVTDA